MVARTRHLSRRGLASTAVMARRVEAPDSFDDFPTPPWAGRALVEHVLIGGGFRREQLAGMSLWEPAANRGWLMSGLAEYFREVHVSDILDYGELPGLALCDFVLPSDRDAEKRAAWPKGGGPDWVISNPPFRLGVEFIQSALAVARVGVAMLVRTAFLEGIERYRTLYANPGPTRTRPRIVAQFSERVPMVRGRYDPDASTATSYCWMVWGTSNWGMPSLDTRLVWIPPCRDALQRPEEMEVARAICRELAPPSDDGDLITGALL